MATYQGCCIACGITQIWIRTSLKQQPQSFDFIKFAAEMNRRPASNLVPSVQICSSSDQQTQSVQSAGPNAIHQRSLTILLIDNHQNKTSCTQFKLARTTSKAISAAVARVTDSPTVSRPFLSAPAFKSKSATSVRPFHAAHSSGVQPS